MSGEQVRGVLVILEYDHHRLIIKEKMFQLRLVEEIVADRTTAKRSQTTGELKKTSHLKVAVFHKIDCRLFGDQDAKTELHTNTS